MLQVVFDAHGRRCPRLRLGIREVDELVGLDEARRQRVHEVALVPHRTQPEIDADAGLQHRTAFANTLETGDLGGRVREKEREPLFNAHRDQKKKKKKKKTNKKKRKKKIKQKEKQRQQQL